MGLANQSQWGEGLEQPGWWGGGLPAIPDSDGPVVVATDDVALTADQVAAGRGHFHHLHTWGRGKRSEVSQGSFRSVITGHLEVRQSEVWEVNNCSGTDHSTDRTGIDEKRTGSFRGQVLTDRQLCGRPTA